MDDSVPNTAECDDRPYSLLALILGLSPDNCSTLIDIIEGSQGDKAEALLIFLSCIFEEGLEITIENFEIILGYIKQVNYAVETKGVEYGRPLTVEEIQEIIDAEHDIAPEEEWQDPEGFIDEPEGDPNILTLEEEVLLGINLRP
jgi:hypothetical protein